MDRFMDTLGVFGCGKRKRAARGSWGEIMKYVIPGYAAMLLVIWGLWLGDVFLSICNIMVLARQYFML